VVARFHRHQAPRMSRLRAPDLIGRYLGLAAPGDAGRQQQGTPLCRAFHGSAFHGSSTTSLLARVPIARHTCRSMLLLTKPTCESPYRTLTPPPGCMLRAEMIACSPGVSAIALQLPQSCPLQLGVATWLYIVPK